MLSAELVARGHEVTLFAAPGSRSPATVVEVLDKAHPDEIGLAIHEVDHVARAFALIDERSRAGRPFDVIHDHCGFAALAMADRIDVPLVHTLHGPFTAATAAFYARHGHRGALVAISRSQLAQAPRELKVPAVVPNPIDCSQWPLVGEKQDYLLWVGRMTEEKGPHRAIAAARLAGHRIVLAGPIQPGQESFFEREVAPHVDGEHVRYVGEIAGERKVALFAHARALLMPIRWAEPFGMVMLEAMVCGTPVVAFPEGAARELVIPGVTGLLVGDEREMAAACKRVAEIDPHRCRQSAVDRFDVRAVAAGYERVYLQALADRARPEPWAGPQAHRGAHPAGAAAHMGTHRQLTASGT